MCNGDTANNTINTCNGYGGDCTRFLEEGGQSGRILKDHPAIWTENEGGFQIWGDDPDHTSDYFWGRTARDLAYETLAWFARGGSSPIKSQIPATLIDFGNAQGGNFQTSILTTLILKSLKPLKPDMF